MSEFITTAFVKQYHDTVKHELQQQQSKLRDLVDVDTLKGKEGFYDFIGATEMVEKLTRHTDTPLIDTPHSRRKIWARTFHWADLVDDMDIAKTLTNPTNAYMQAGLMAARRKFDTLILAAAIATAYSGVDGATGIPLPASQKVTIQEGAAADTGLTIAKLRKARRIFRANEVPAEEQLFMACNADMLDNLLADAKVQSTDYNSIKALVDGNIDTFMGFKFVHTELLSLDSNSNYAGIAWAKMGIKLAIAQDIKTNISVRGDKSNAVQPYIELQAGSARMDEKRVVEIACKPNWTFA